MPEIQFHSEKIIIAFFVNLMSAKGVFSPHFAPPILGWALLQQKGSPEFRALLAARDTSGVGSRARGTRDCGTRTERRVRIAGRARVAMIPAQTLASVSGVRFARGATIGN